MIERRQIHFHSDCAFFAGCENMLVNFWTSPEIRRRFDVSFSYRASERYAAGLQSRARVDFPVSPLRCPDLNDPSMLPAQLPMAVKRVVMFVLRLTLTYPLLAYEVVVLALLFRRRRPDAVHINCGGYPAPLSGPAAAIAARLAGVRRVVMVVNNMAIGYARPARWLDYPLDRLVARCVSGFVTGSSAAAAELRAVLRLSDSQCRALPNGVALRPTSETPEQTRSRLGVSACETTVFGIVAVHRHNKGHQILLEAMANLRARVPSPPVTLLIEGDGPLRHELERYTESTGLTASCRFIGDETNVMNFLAAVDVIVLPSLYGEDFPNVVLEAMGMGRPVIASRMCGTPEQVIDGITGRLVEPGDVAGLADAMARLAEEPSMRAGMGRAGRARFEECFTAAAAVKRYLPLYGEANEG